MVRQSSHLAAVPLEAPDSAAARAIAPSVHLVLPKEHAILLVLGGDGELEPRVPSMRTLQLAREMEWRSLAARTRAHMPLASACEAVPLGAVHHGPTHRNMLRARDGRLSTMQVMRRWRQKLTRVAIPAHPSIFCGGPEEDIGHMRLQCARDEEVARLLCRRVEEFTAELPLTDRGVEFMAWREHGCRWTESLMAGVVPGDLKRLFAAVRAASSRGRAKAKLFVEDMVQVGEDVWPVSPVLWGLRHAVGHRRQPWDPRDRARQELSVGARCPVTPVDGMISGCDYDYDYIYIYIYVYIYIYIL